ncbi:MAG: hypothetical protein ABIO70_19005 [Pseudomonadota bacterium]
MASAALVAVAIGLTWPASLHPTRYALGGLERPTMDGEVFLADVMRDALLHGHPLRWFVTDLVNYPFGQDLGPRVAHSWQLYLELLAVLPLGPLFGLGVAGALLLALNGLAAYALGRRVLRADAPAFVVGLFFELNTYTQVKLSLGSLHKTHQCWLPLLLLALLHMADRATLRSVLPALAVLTFGYLCYPVYAFYALLFAGLFVAWELASRRRWRLAALGALLAVGFAGVNLIIDRLLGFSVGDGETIAPPVAPPAFFPNGTFDLLHPLHQMLGPPTDLPIGLSVIALALGGVALARRGASREWFLAAGFLLFLLLAGGPWVGWEGHPVEIAGVPLYLPHRLLQAIPTFYGSGVGLFFPVRALPVAMLCLALLGGFAVQRLARLLGVHAGAVAALVALLYVGEHLVRFPRITPAVTGPIVLPAVLTDLAAADPGAAILHLPPTRDPGACHRYCLYSSAAGMKSVNPYDREGLWLDVPTSRSPEGARQEFVDRLLAADVRVIMVHGGYREPAFPAVDLAWLERALAGPGDVRREGPLTVYHLPEGLSVGGARP